MKDTKVFVPELPESVSGAIFLKWHKKIGDTVKEDELIAEIETDKIILEIASPISGIITTQFYKAGESVNTQDVLAYISPEIYSKEKKEKKDCKNFIKITKDQKQYLNHFSPTIRRMILNKKINLKKINEINQNHQLNSNDYIKNNILYFLKKNNNDSLENNNKIKKNEFDKRSTTRIAMNPLRKKISERLLFTTHNTAMLTTFNEINMREVIKIRKKYQDIFFQKYAVRLGYMSFFITAATKALEQFPDINASIDKHDIVYHNYYDINIAISTKRGLIAPILLNTNLMDMFQIEKKIKYFSDLGSTGKLSLNDLQSGTFTITNGGVFGSLMSTPMINPPQAAILGMHSIKKRPVADNNKIKILPMMYVALSYDHRIIDGKTAIKFLSYIKDILEDTSRIILNI